MKDHLIIGMSKRHKNDDFSVQPDTPNFLPQKQKQQQQQHRTNQKEQQELNHSQNN